MAAAAREASREPARVLFGLPSSPDPLLDDSASKSASPSSASPSSSEESSDLEDSNPSIPQSNLQDKSSFAGCTPIKLGAVPAHFDKLFNERYDELLLESTPTKTTGGDVGDSGSKIRDALSRKRKAKELESIATPKKASSGTNSLANTAPPAMRRSISLTSSSGFRYFGGSSTRGPKCFNCGKRGHIRSDCTEPKKPRPCHLCGSCAHPSTRCPCVRCDHCWDFGHTSHFCRNSQMKLMCHHCGLDTHDTVMCPLVEKSPDDLRLVTCATCGQKGHTFCGALQSPKDLWCCNCGKKGHTHLSCPAPRQQVFAHNGYASRGGRGRSPVTCFNCGQTGHVRSRCPNRRPFSARPHPNNAFGRNGQSPRGGHRIGRGPSPRGGHRIGRGPSPRGGQRIGRGPSPRGGQRIGRGPSPRGNHRIVRGPSPRGGRGPSPRGGYGLGNGPSPRRNYYRVTTTLRGGPSPRGAGGGYSRTVLSPWPRRHSDPGVKRARSRR